MRGEERERKEKLDEEMRGAKEAKMKHRGKDNLRERWEMVTTHWEFRFI